MNPLNPELKSTLNRWRAQGETIVFTNGVFDLLHAGHVTYLQGARQLGHRLVVGVNSDSSVRMLGKGPERPINDQGSRKLVLEALRSVDLAVVFSAKTPLELIKQVRPDVLVKGGDYNPEVKDLNSPSYIVGSHEVLYYGGKVAVIPFLAGHSTTSMLQKSRSKD
jgi:D-beta-D-heptose 7-phosphate kinase/D-beta-D-heptose 1-phosphate adenosyltransferase